MSTLLLRFGAPLQSWGSSSLYDRRESDAMPTKSGVIGLLAAALGRRRNESLEDLNALRFGVRIDLRGERINDFQITHMGEKLNANISNRVYLSDALFLIGLGSEDESFLAEIDQAVNHPAFPLFLGRRSCPPSMPFNLGIRDCELYDALYKEPWMVPGWRREELFRFEKEVRLRIIMDAEDGVTKKDLPVSFSPYKRQYRYRYVKEMPAKVIQKPLPVDAEQKKDAARSVYMEHDPMKELR